MTGRRFIGLSVFQLFPGPVFLLTEFRRQSIAKVRGLRILAESRFH